MLPERTGTIVTTDTPEDDNTTFGALDDSDLDFGAPALDSDAESTFSADGFSASRVASGEDRITPGHLFAPRTPLSPPSAADQPAPQAVPASVPQAVPQAVHQAVPQAPVPDGPSAAAPIATTTWGPTSVTAPASPTSPVLPAPAAAFGHNPNAVAFGPGTTSTSTLPPPRTPKTATKKKWLLLGGAAGLALVIAGSALAAYKVGVFGAVGPQPEHVMPGNRFAYASVDFNPSTQGEDRCLPVRQEVPLRQALDRPSSASDTDRQPSDLACQEHLGRLGINLSDRYRLPTNAPT